MSEVRYNKLFAEKVGGKVRARFRLEEGEPFYEADEDEEGNELRHYYIFVSLEAPKATVEQVTYNLLDETYEDPVAESDDPNDNFRTDITSYGDYPIRIEAQTGARVYVQKAKLSELLKDGHPDWNTHPKIREGIEFIENH
jgi:hypothetical protein